MNEEFRALIEPLEERRKALLAMEPVTVPNLPRGNPTKETRGVYLFSENGKHLYAGRTNRMRGRLQEHCRPSSMHNTAPFAFRLAHQLTLPDHPEFAKMKRSKLQIHPEFKPEFVKQKERVRKMNVRWVREDNPRRQALLEVYVAVSLDTPYNDFDNH